MMQLIAVSRVSNLAHFDSDGEGAAHLGSSRQYEDVKVTVREVGEHDDEEVVGLTNATAECQISPHEFGHHRALPEPLDVVAIRGAKEKMRKIARAKANPDIISDGDNQSSLGGAESKSIESFVTGVSSEFEDLSMPGSSEAEHNGSGWKWYKGFRRSG
jgi:hypothetical protein